MKVLAPTAEAPVSVIRCAPATISSRLRFSADGTSIGDTVRSDRSSTDLGSPMAFLSDL
jgi:hypothetical protein